MRCPLHVLLLQLHAQNGILTPNVLTTNLIIVKIERVVVRICGPITMVLATTLWNIAVRLDGIVVPAISRMRIDN